MGSRCSKNVTPAEDSKQNTEENLLLVSNTKDCECGKVLLYGFLRDIEKQYNLSYPIPDGIYVICSSYYSFTICPLPNQTDKIEEKHEWTGALPYLNFYIHLAIFIEHLPPKTKAYFWKHDVFKKRNGSKHVLDHTTKFKHVRRLIVDSIIAWNRVNSFIFSSIK